MLISYFEYIQWVRYMQCIRCNQIAMQKEIEALQSSVGSTFVGSWDETQQYTKGQTIFYLDKTYQCLVSNSGQNPSTATTYWKYVGPFVVNGGGFFALQNQTTISGEKF